MSFETEIKIHFDEADPAGIAFSGNIFTKVHRCYEDFIEALEQNPKKFFLDSETIAPLRHIEVEYMGPLFPLSKYPVSIDVIKLGESSFQLQFLIKNEEKTLCTVKSTHVCCDKETMEKRAIPESLKTNLERFVLS